MLASYLVVIIDLTSKEEKPQKQEDAWRWTMNNKRGEILCNIMMAFHSVSTMSLTVDPCWGSNKTGKVTMFLANKVENVQVSYPILGQNLQFIKTSFFLNHKKNLFTLIK